METTPAPADADRVLLDSITDVAEFFAFLLREQAKYLDSVEQCAALLGGQSAHLAQVTAHQMRLTRQFFEAQAAIMRHRANVDAEVIAITRAADEEAAATIVAARRSLADAIAARNAHPSMGTDAALWPDGAAQVDLLLAEAFRSDVPDEIVAEHQLSELIESWWVAEAKEGDALIEDAHARAMMRTHLAEMEAQEIAASFSNPDGHGGNAPTGGTGPSDSLLPEAFTIALQRATAADLPGLLDELSASLRPPSAAPTPRPAADGSTAHGEHGGAVLIQIADPAVALPALAAGNPLPGPHWDRGLPRRRQRRPWWLARPIVLPVVAASALFAALLVWIGWWTG